MQKPNKKVQIKSTKVYNSMKLKRNADSLIDYSVFVGNKEKWEKKNYFSLI